MADDIIQTSVGPIDGRKLAQSGLAGVDNVIELGRLAW
jgi:hypothetical protein